MIDMERRGARPTSSPKRIRGCADKRSRGPSGPSPESTRAGNTAGAGRRRTPEADKGHDLSALPAKAAFAEDGYVRLPGVLSEDEVAALEVVYDRFLRQEIRVDGKDFCDMAGDYGQPV